MNNRQSIFNDLADKITSKVIDLMNDFEKCKTAKLVAICENEFPLDNDIAKLYEHQKTISLGVNFVDLETYTKLVVVKSAIKTHYQTVNGKIQPYGQILYYKLKDNSKTYRAFDLDGKLMIEDSTFNTVL
jgi:hypothetical protein